MFMIDGQCVKKLNVNGHDVDKWIHNGVEIFAYYQDIVTFYTELTTKNPLLCHVDSNKFSRVRIDINTASISADSGSGDLTLACVTSHDGQSSDYVYDSVVIAKTNGYTVEGQSVYLNLPPNHSMVDIVLKKVGSSSSLSCTITYVRAYA